MPTTAAWWQEPGFPGVPAPSGAAADGLDHLRPLRPTDLDRRWFLDFHHPRPLVPLALPLVDDIGTASQAAAHELPVGVGGGFAARLVGPHVVLGPCPAPEPDPDHRAAAAEELDRYPARFPGEWGQHSAELLAGYARLDAVDLAASSAAQVATYLGAARRLHRRAWQIHFRVMYRLFALQQRFLAACRDVGLAEVDAVALLGTADTLIRAADRALAELAAAAGPAGLADVVRAAPPGRVLPALRGRPEAAGWLAGLDAVLAVHGQRSDALSDLTAPSWAEDPEIPLALVRATLECGPGQPPVPADQRSQQVLDTLSPAARRRLEPALVDVQRADVAWWNEEHNALIDLRVHLPVRRVALALAAHWRTPARDDVLLLTAPEVDAVLAGAASWADLAPLAGARRDYLAGWRGRRAELPAVLGSGPAVVDVVLDEILGASAGRPPGDAAADLTLLTGLGVSGGTATGPARLLRTAAELAEVRPGEVLVCEATSPSWTPVFDRLAGCVCDAGGMLTHAAIISREYGLPCVCAVGTATRTIRTGDVVRVDGTAGTVRVLARAPRAGPAA